MATKTKQQPPSAAEIEKRLEAFRALASAEDRASRPARREHGEHGLEHVEPDAPHLESAKNMLAGYDERVCPIAAREMQELREAVEAVMLPPGGDAPYGGFAPSREQTLLRFWRCREAAQEAIFREPPPPPMRYTPSQMHEQKVSARQIAIEWQWLLDDGSPDYERVAREIASPGSELTPEAIAERHEVHLRSCGWRYVEPPSPDIEALTEELLSVVSYEQSMAERLSAIRTERERLEGLLAQARG